MSGRSGRVLRVLGTSCVVFYTIHAIVHVRRGEPYEIAWGCTVANLVIGAGLLWPSARLNAIGVSWLVLGDALWLIDLWSGSELLPTSLLTHLGGLGAGLYGVRRLGWPRRSFLWATVALMALHGATRLCTPPAININVAFRVPPVAGDLVRGAFPGYSIGYPLYYAAMLAIALAVFFLTEWLCGSFLSTR